MIAVNQAYRHGRHLFVVLFVVLLCAASARAEDKPDTDGLQFFENKIRPVLVQHCYKCHSSEAKEIKGGLRVDTREGIRKGGDTDHAVVPGNVRESLLISAIQHADLEMPPKSKLPDNVIGDFVRWVKMGAPDPRASNAIAGVQETIDIEKGREFWSLQPLSRSEPPAVKDAQWPRSQIDHYVLARLEASGLTPVGDADKATLVRRVYFDLIGLPPSPEEVEDLVAKKSSQSLPQLIDRLLDSPQFGERWGRHWLDVVRYAESNGNVRNVLYPHAWRYRDYVIDAMNRDTPYDQFLTEQIAGDLLPAKDENEKKRNLIATGFLALASRPVSKGNREYRMDLVADQIEVTTRASMALTVACARCHDHKFDPIPTHDYYAMAGIFTSSDVLHGGTGANGMAAGELHVLGSLPKTTEDKPKVEPAKAARAEATRLAARLKELKAEIKSLTLAQRGGKNKNKKRKRQAGSDKDKKEKSKADQKPQVDQAEIAKRIAALRTEVKSVQGKLKKAGGQKRKKGGKQSKYPPGTQLAMGARDSGKPVDARIHIRGESQRLGDAVPRGFLQVISIDDAASPGEAQSGRLELARWITDEQNPLTARVMVNRIWQHLIGQGIVGTPDNFGLNGERPTHPELLDYLATRFMQDGWSTKRMIREIMLSRTYQLSAMHHAANAQKDPANKYFWRHPSRRLDAESLRDSILLVSGQLELEPPNGSIVTRHGDGIIRDNLTVDKFRVPSSHRSVYLPIIRNGLPELLGVFDFADPSLVVGKRNVTTVPSQALYLINSPFVVEQSRHFAERLLADENLDDAERLQLAYRLALTRQPTEEEIQRGASFIAATAAALADDDNNQAAGSKKAWSSFCQALLASSEFRYVD